MQGKVYEIPLDISSGVLTTQIRTLVTEDMGTNTFRFKVVRDNHVPYDFTGTIVRMMVKTPSGARIQQECTIENAVGGTVSLTLKQSLLLEHGSYIAELQIFDAITQSIRLTTPTFTYHVRQSLQNSESIVATDEYTILQEALADLAGINIVVADKADKSDVGDLEDLATEEKANLVQAINEVKSQSNEMATVELPKKANKKEEDWKVATLKNGWQGTVRYRRNGFGYLEISGNPFGGVTSSGTSLFTLPQEYINSFYGGIFTNDGGSEKMINCTMIDGDFKIHSTSLYQIYINLIIAS